MRCQEVREWMSLRLDGSLPADQERQLDLHLDGCAVCAEEWARWQEIASLFEAAPLLQPPEDLTARVLVRIQKPRPRVIVGGLTVMALGLAVLGLLLVAPLVGTCGMAIRTAQTPGMLGIVVSVLSALVEFTAIVARVGRTLLLAVMTPQSAAVAMGYAAAFIVALAGWLRLVARPVRAPAKS